MRNHINTSSIASAPGAVDISRLPVLADYLKAEDNNFALVRLLMALAVLVSHSWWLATGQTDAEPLHIWTNHSLGEHAVQVFFFLSGVVVAQSLFRSKSILDFAFARALRIFPALIVCVLVTALLLGPAVSALSLSGYFTDPGLIAYIFKTLSLSTGSAPLPGVFADNPVPRLVNLSLWTLKYEVLCYALLGVFGMLHLALPKLRPYLTGALVLIIALIFVGEPKPASSYTALDNVRYFVLFFGMGTLAYLFRERLVLSWLALPLLLLAFVFAIGTRYAEITSALFLGYGTLLFASLKLPRLRWFTNDQDYSYAVYILHCPIQQVLVQFKPGIDPIELTLVTLALVLPLSVLSWTHVERPAMNARRALVGWLRSLALGRGPAAPPLNLDRSTAETMPNRKESAMLRDKLTTIQLGVGQHPMATVRSNAPDVSRSHIAEWFSRKRQAEQVPAPAAISEQFAARIRAAARQAEETRTRDPVILSVAMKPVVDDAKMHKVSRTRRFSRISKIDPESPQAANVPARPRTRPPRISHGASTKLWARPSRMVLSNQSEPVQASTVRVAKTARAADRLGVALATAHEAKPGDAAAFGAVVATRPGVLTAPYEPGVAAIEPAQASAASVDQVAPAVCDHLNRLMARRNESIHKRLARQRSSPIPLA